VSSKHLKQEASAGQIKIQISHASVQKQNALIENLYLFNQRIQYLITKPY